jgi:hypothetical protein
MDWILLAKGMKLWRALVNTVMNRRVLENFVEILDSLNGYRLLSKVSAA